MFSKFGSGIPIIRELPRNFLFVLARRQRFIVDRQCPHEDTAAVTNHIHRPRRGRRVLDGNGFLERMILHDDDSVVVDNERKIWRMVGWNKDDGCKRLWFVVCFCHA